MQEYVDSERSRWRIVKKSDKTCLDVRESSVYDRTREAIGAVRVEEMMRKVLLSEHGCE